MTDPHIRSAFDAVTADDSLKARTKAAVLARAPRKTAPALRAVRWAACCAAAFLLLIGIGAYLFFDETAYVSIDVNPSIELGLNRFHVVVSQTAYNADGEQLLRRVDMRYRSLDDAMTTLLESDAFAPFAAPSSAVCVTVLGDDAEQEALLDTLAQNDACAHLHADCTAEQTDLRDQAHENGLSFGKYRAFLTLQQYDDTVTAAQCREMTMRELHDLIDAHCRDASDPASENDPADDGSQSQPSCDNENGGNGGGNGSGNGSGGNCDDSGNGSGDSDCDGNSSGGAHHQYGHSGG